MGCVALGAALLSACGLPGDSAPPAAAAPQIEQPPLPVPARQVGDMKILFNLPSEGQAGGVAVDGDTLYVDTFDFVTTPTEPNHYLFAYDLKTNALKTGRPNPIAIPRRKGITNMGLSGLALDAKGLVYAVDMNGRVVRINPLTGEVKDYSLFLTSDAAPQDSMPLDMAFDAQGYAYVTDIAGLPLLYRIPPGGGMGENWFVDQRLLGPYSQGAGGIRFDPTGKFLYVAVNASLHPDYEAHGLIFKIPVADPAAMTVFSQFESAVEATPLGAGPLGLAVGKSGKLYVALPGTNQVKVLKPDGTEEQRFTLQHSTQFVALTETGSLIVSTWGDVSAGPWPIYDIYVNDTPLPLARPSLPDAAP